MAACSGDLGQSDRNFDARNASLPTRIEIWSQRIISTIDNLLTKCLDAEPRFHHPKTDALIVNLVVNLLTSPFMYGVKQIADSMHKTANHWPALNLHSVL